MTLASQGTDRILIVDDNQQNIQVLGTFLREKEYQINVAMNGQEAIEVAQKINPDIILLDIMMPIMDGYEACKILKEKEKTKDIPILFLSAKSEVEDVIKGFDFGAVDYITKPFNIKELLSRVETHLELRRNRRELEKANQKNKQLIHVLCHDITNPLSVISGCLDVAKTDPSFLESFKDDLVIATQAGLDIVDLTRQMMALESKGLSLKVISLNNALDKSITIINRNFERKNITIQTDIPDNIQVVSEPTSLTNSVINNILTNAVKFSERGSTIEIKARQLEDSAILTITDHGIGMPQNILSHLFDVNKNISRQGTEDENGTGFGMPLVKQFVEAYGGQIQVLSKCKDEYPDDHGTTFIITFKHE